MAHKKFIYFFFLFNCILLFITFNHPIGDFGNYYYGSKFFLQGIDPLKIYQDTHFFNSEIRQYQHGVFFENYGPVPPFSLLFYVPLTFLNISIAKLLFSIVSLVVFCFSLDRLIKQTQFFCLWFYLLPIIFLQPLFSNFHQGQTYLLIAALLFEFYIAFQNNKKVTIGWIIVLLFALKIFPAFIAILLILKKDWKAIKWVAFFSAILCAICYFAIGSDTINYYYLDIFPRLAANDITAPFYFFNQSLYVFLLNAFVAHPYLNTAPFFDMPIMAVIIQFCFCVFVLSMCIKIVLKHNLMVGFVTILVVLFLLNKYSTVYSLVVLFPFIFLFKDLPDKRIITISSLIFLICNIPVYKLGYMPLILQYPRVWLIIAVFILLVITFKPGFELKYFIISVIIFAFPSLAFLKYVNHGEAELRPKSGILYDFSVTADKIKLSTCLGNRDSVEYINFAAATIDSTNFEMNKPGFLPGSKAVFVNNKQLIYMTDENNGVGMYYLKVKTPRVIK